MKAMHMSPMRNPVFVLAWALPAAAVLACVLTIVITLGNPDSPLPEQYHWEGFQLDRDFSRAAKAAELRVHATMTALDAAGECEIRLSMDGPHPSQLELMLAHATKPDLDRRVTFTRVPTQPGWNDAASLYRGRCSALREGHWRMELVDSVNGWAMRQSVRGSLANVTLDAVSGTRG
jgi:hypothetical protein